MDMISGGIVLAGVFLVLSLIAFPVTYTKTKGSWPSKLLAALFVSLILLPGACFGTWIGGEATGFFRPYHP